MVAYEGPNVDQIRYWNEVMGLQWAALDVALSAQLRPLGLKALERLDVRLGERVLDIGCGGGETTADIARRVGPTGRVVGIDISELLAARARVAIADLPHAEIRVEDAQIASLEPEAYDALFSRFGVMFFSDPQAAFANMKRALRPGGRLTFICWRAFVDNPWSCVPAMAVAELVPIKRPEPHVPGPFALADEKRVRGILENAGFVQVKHEALDEVLCVGGGEPINGTVAMLLRLGPAGGALRDANADPELMEAARAAIKKAILPYDSPQGVLLPSASWIVTAQRP